MTDTTPAPGAVAQERRLVTAIPGPDGSLYVTDDDAGLIYRITPGA